MKLELNNEVLRVKLNPLEMFFALRGSLNIPVDRIIGVTTEKPGWEWAIRSPGTHIPFLLKAGTYNTVRGFEFWSTTIGKPYLVIDLQGWTYNRVVLTMSENREWAKKISVLLT